MNKKIAILFIVSVILIVSQTGLAVSQYTPDEEDALNNAGRDLIIARTKGDYPKALEVCEKIRTINNSMGEFYYSETYQEMEKHNAALEWAKKVVESAKNQNESTETPLLNLSTCYFLNGEQENSRKTLEEVIKLYPKSPAGYKSMAQYYEEIGNREKALEYWKETKKRSTEEQYNKIAEEKIESLEASLKQK